MRWGTRRAEGEGAVGAEVGHAGWRGLRAKTQGVQCGGAEPLSSGGGGDDGGSSSGWGKLSRGLPGDRSAVCVPLNTVVASARSGRRRAAACNAGKERLRMRVRCPEPPQATRTSAGTGCNRVPSRALRLRRAVQRSAGRQRRAGQSGQGRAGRAARAQPAAQTGRAPAATTAEKCAVCEKACIGGTRDRTYYYVGAGCKGAGAETSAQVTQGALNRTARSPCRRRIPLRLPLRRPPQRRLRQRRRHRRHRRLGQRRRRRGNRIGSP